MFTCKLQIEGLYRKLSLEDGLNLKDLTELLSKLSRCLGKSASKFTLTTIENTSYSPVIETDDSEVVDGFNEIHKLISNTEIERLPKEHQDYAIALNKILFKNNLYITTHNSKDESSVKLTSLTKLDSKQYYYIITTIHGKLISLYGKNEKSPYIALKTRTGIDYTIHVTPNQEKEVSSFYKGLSLHLRVRLKKDVKNGNILHADLIDYTIPENISFFQIIENVKREYGDIFKNVSDSAKHLQEIRGVLND